MVPLQSLPPADVRFVNYECINASVAARGNRPKAILIKKDNNFFAEGASHSSTSNTQHVWGTQNGVSYCKKTVSVRIFWKIRPGTGPLFLAP